MTDRSTVRRTPAERLALHRAINQRPKRCPQCGETVQAGNLARHRRSLAHTYARRAA